VRKSQSKLTSNPIRLVLSDLDGTLLDPDKAITPRAKAAVSELGVRGIEFSVCSGRPARGMLDIVREAQVSLPYGALNGGVTLSKDHEVTSEIRLSASHAKQAIAYFSEKMIETWLFTARDWLVLNFECRLVAREVNAVKFEPTAVASFAPYMQEAVKIVGVSEDHERLALLELDIKEHLGPGAFASRSNLSYLDVTNERANKGEFLRWIAGERGIAPENILSIGDMPCDAEMFPHSGLGIAMGSSPQSVKDRATHVTGANDAEGFALAIEEYVLDSK
jgi:Cof subfamily protein (haloacid dehalogenase superfamily)